MHTELLALRDRARTAADEIDSLHCALAVFNAEAWPAISPDHRRDCLIQWVSFLRDTASGLLSFAPLYAEVEAEFSPALTAAAMRLAREDGCPREIVCCVGGTEETVSHWTQVIERVSSVFRLKLPFLEELESQEAGILTIEKRYIIFRTGLAKTPEDTWPGSGIVKTNLDHEYAEALNWLEARSPGVGGDEKSDELVEISKAELKKRLGTLLPSGEVEPMPASTFAAWVKKGNIPATSQTRRTITVPGDWLARHPHPADSV
jgi:hypothetical protein